MKIVNDKTVSVSIGQAIAIGICVILGFGLVGYLDAQDEVADADNYCKMVAVWKAEEARGIPANDRSGWPPFRGDCK